MCEQRGWLVDYRGHAASVRLRWRPECWGPPRLSLHATPLSNPLFDNYLLCCLGRGWGHHAYINDTKTVATRVRPPPFDMYRPIRPYTLTTLGITGLQDGLTKWLSVTCCCWVRKIKSNWTIPFNTGIRSGDYYVRTVCYSYLTNCIEAVLTFVISASCLLVCMKVFRNTDELTKG